MSYIPSSLKAGIYGGLSRGVYIGVTKQNTRSLDYSTYVVVQAHGSFL